MELIKYSKKKKKITEWEFETFSLFYAILELDRNPRNGKKIL